MKKDKTVFSDISLSIFCSELHLFIKSGYSVADALSVMIEDSKKLNSHRNDEEILVNIYNKCEEGKPLYSSIEEAGGFPQYMINMIKLGEKTGRLEAVMFSLYKYFEQKSELSQKFKNAVLYPSMLFIAMLAVFTVLIVKILPVFNDLFTKLGIKMSLLSLAFISIGNFLIEYGFFILPLIIIAAILLYIFKNKIKQSSKISKKIEIARFASAMSMAMSSGFDVNESLNISLDITEAAYIKQKINKCLLLMDKGSSFSEAISEINIFSSAHNRLISVGIKTGALDKIMSDVAVRCDEEAFQELEDKIALIEPTMIIAMCLLISLIIISVMFPLTGLMGIKL